MLADESHQSLTVRPTPRCGCGSDHYLIPRNPVRVNTRNRKLKAKRKRPVYLDSAEQIAAMLDAATELGDRLLPGFDRRLSRYAEAALRRRGVDVRLHTRVERIDAGAIVLDGGERIRASTIVWAGGVSAPAWLIDTGMASEHGRVLVDADLRLAEHPNAFVIGDAAAVRSRSGPLQPQVAQVAVQGGRHAARQIERLIAGRPTRSFRYFDKGTMAMVGVYAAVVQSGRLRLTGRVAWVAWGLLHVAYLPRMSNRLRALQTWRWWHVTHEASARMLIDDRAEQQPARAEIERSRRQPPEVRDD